MFARVLEVRQDLNSKTFRSLSSPLDPTVFFVNLIVCLCLLLCNSLQLKENTCPPSLISSFELRYQEWKTLSASTNSEQHYQHVANMK